VLKDENQRLRFENAELRSQVQAILAHQGRPNQFFEPHKPLISEEDIQVHMQNVVQLNTQVLDMTEKLSLLPQLQEALSKQQESVRELLDEKLREFLASVEKRGEITFNDQALSSTPPSEAVPTNQDILSVL
jgi:hypothetical protein